MLSILKNLHWIIIFIAILVLARDAYELNNELESHKGEKAKVEEDILKNESTKKEIKKYLSNIEEEKAKIERVAQEIEKTQQLLPSDISDTENISLLRRMGEDINIKEISIMPEQDENNGFYFVRKYKFKAKATYLQFLIMLEKIAENKRILNIGELEFRKLDQPQRSKFQLINGAFSLIAYKYNSNYKEDRGFEQIELQIKGNNPPAGANSKKKSKPVVKRAESAE